MEHKDGRQPPQYPISQFPSSSGVGCVNRFAKKTLYRTPPASCAGAIPFTRLDEIALLA